MFGHCWPGSPHHSPPDSFSATLSIAWVFCEPSAGSVFLPYWTSSTCPQTSIQPVSSSFWKTFLPYSRSTFHPSLLSPAKWQRWHSILSSTSRIKILNKTSPNTDQHSYWLAANRKWHYLPLLSGHSHTARFHPVHLSKPWAASFCRGVLWEVKSNVSKAQVYPATACHSQPFCHPLNESPCQRGRWICPIMTHIS